jgi:hypothetical protein
MSPVGASVVIAVVKPWTLDVPVSRPALPCHIAPLVGGRRRYFYTLKNQLQKLLIIFCDDPLKKLPRRLDQVGDIQYKCLNRKPVNSTSLTLSKSTACGSLTLQAA